MLLTILWIKQTKTKDKLVVIEKYSVDITSLGLRTYETQ